MYTPPLHRKVLPWLYTLLFFLAAPIVVFYTAGYRYNTKKATLEKRGTLITDTIPTGAAITIDGQSTQTKTPSVFQELTPGWHRVRFEKPGYTSWEKTLEIKPERVTFADQAHLWRTEPEIGLVVSGTISTVATNPDRDTLAAFESSTTSRQDKLLLLQAKGRISLEASVTSTHANETTLSWQDDSRALLIDREGGRDTAVRFNRATIYTTTTPAQAFWHESELLAPIKNATWHWNSRTGLSSLETTTSTIRERVDAFVLPQTTTGTSQLLVDRTFSSRAFSLPTGLWHFARVSSDMLFLQDGQRWLGINPQQTSSFLGLIESKAPKWITPADGLTKGLFLQGNELWLWPFAQSPILLVRQSTPIRAVAWHESGEAIFLATNTTIEVLDLDMRGGIARHPIVTFEAIYDMDTLGKILYVAGKKDGIDGVWSIVLE